MSARHGTASGYVTDRCRCEECRRANRERQRARNLRLLEERYGVRPSLFVPIEDVRAHVQMLMAHGMGWRRIAQEAGVSTATMSSIIGWYDRGWTRTRRSTAERIWAVQPVIADGTKVDGTGSIRRLQALLAIGWSRAEIARRLGRTPQSLGVTMRCGYVTERTRKEIAELYDRLCMTPGPSVRAASEARRRGWAPPLAWDDIDTDHEPAPVDNVRQLRHDPDTCNVCNETRWGREQGMTPQEVAASLGMTGSALHIHLRRWTDMAGWANELDNNYRRQREGTL